MARTIIILGGSLGGLGVAHRLLKHTQPRERDLRVIIVSKNSHFYWNLASVRAVIPNIIKDEDLLQPIQPGLDQYPLGSVELVIGAATCVDTASKTVCVSLAADTGGGGNGKERTLAYDHLVVATGTNGFDREMPWKAAGSYQECLDSLHDTAARIQHASHVVVAGGGATGVELAGEIKYAYPQKTVVLLNANAQLCHGDATAGAIERELTRLGVDVRNDVKGAVDSSSVGDSGSKQKVTLSDGSQLWTDLYLPTTGFTPNSEFLPGNLLTDKGYVDVDDYLRARTAPDVWAVGDIICKPRAGFLITDAQAAGVAKNIDLVLRSKSPAMVKGPPVDGFMCSIGRSRGAGRLGAFSIPSFLVWVIKGRTLGKERTLKYANGTMF